MMNSKVAPTYPLNVGGELRNLRYDFNALALIEEKTGKSTLSGEVFQNLRASDLRWFLWGGLVHENPNLDVTEVGSWIHLGNLAYITEAIGKAFSSSMPDQEKTGETPLPQG